MLKNRSTSGDRLSNMGCTTHRRDRGWLVSLVERQYARRTARCIGRLYDGSLILGVSLRQLISRETTVAVAFWSLPSGTARRFYSGVLNSHRSGVESGGPFAFYRFLYSRLFSDRNTYSYSGDGLAFSVKRTQSAPNSTRHPALFPALRGERCCTLNLMRCSPTVIRY